MSVRKVKAGLTSVTEQVFAGDSSSTTGGGLAVVYNSAGLVFEYRRWGQNSWTAITPIAGTLGTYASGGVVADGSLTGALEVCPPDAAFAAGVKGVTVRLRGVTNLVPIQLRYELDAVDYQDAVRMGLTALPNAAANAANGLHTRGAGTGQFETNLGAISLVDFATGVGTVSLLGANAIQFPSFAEDSITAFAIDVTAVAEFRSGLSTLDAAGVRTAVGLGSANLDTQLDTKPTAAQVDTQLSGTHGAGAWTDAGGGQAITVEMNTIEGE